MDFDTLIKGVGAQIRFLRREKGWTQVELADRAGVHAAVVGELERGHTRRGKEVNPQLHTLFQIANALGVGVVDLFPGASSGDKHQSAVEDVRSLLLTRDAAFARQIYQVTQALIDDKT